MYYIQCLCEQSIRPRRRIFLYSWQGTSTFGTHTCTHALFGTYGQYAVRTFTRWSCLTHANILLMQLAACIDDAHTKAHSYICIKCMWMIASVGTRAWYLWNKSCEYIHTCVHTFYIIHKRVKIGNAVAKWHGSGCCTPTTTTEMGRSQSFFPFRVDDIREDGSY